MKREFLVGACLTAAVAIASCGGSGGEEVSSASLQGRLLPASALPGFGVQRTLDWSDPVNLVVTEGQMAGTSLPLGRQGVLIGRGPECTLVLDDEFASSRHARIFPRAEGWFVEDQGSRNGTTVNGVKITGAVPVESGAVVRIGRTTLELRG
jgi:hypothetical protein